MLTTAQNNRTIAQNILAIAKNNRTIEKNILVTT